MTLNAQSVFYRVIWQTIFLVNSRLSGNQILFYLLIFCDPLCNLFSYLYGQIDIKFTVLNIIL